MKWRYSLSFLPSLEIHRLYSGDGRTIHWSLSSLVPSLVTEFELGELKSIKSDINFEKKILFAVCNWFCRFWFSKIFNSPWKSISVKLDKYRIEKPYTFKINVKNFVTNFLSFNSSSPRQYSSLGLNCCLVCMKDSLMVHTPYCKKSNRSRTRNSFTSKLINQSEKSIFFWKIRICILSTEMT